MYTFNFVNGDKNLYNLLLDNNHRFLRIPSSVGLVFLTRPCKFVFMPMHINSQE